MQNDLFPQWLAQTSVQQDSDKYHKLVAGVSSSVQLVSRRPALIWPQIFLGQRVTHDQKQIFRRHFQKHDPFFGVEPDDFLLQVLAGMCLVHLWEKGTSEAATLSAMAVHCGMLIKYDPLPIPDMRNRVIAFLRGEATKARCLQDIRPKAGQTIDDSLRTIKQLHNKISQATGPLREQTYTAGFDALTNALLHVQASFSPIIHNQLIIQEETNVLWWLNAKRSTIVASPIPDLRLVLDLAIDLTALLEIMPPIASCPQILAEVCNRSVTDPLAKVDLFGLMQSLERVYREGLVARFQGTDVAGLCPLLTYIHASTQVPDGEDFRALVRHQFKSDLPDMNIAELANAAFWELALVRAANKDGIGHGISQVREG